MDDRVRVLEKRINELSSERDKWRNSASLLDRDLQEASDRIKGLEVILFEMSEDRDNWKQTAMEAKQAIVELEVEYQQPSIDIAPDNVNSPIHYTQGGIETIDFIRAKLTPEEFTGYCKGNVLKYVSRATHKGGLEDLRKAGKYIEFAVGGAL